ncbi:transmembrane protein 237-like [Nilaparvata lugens]|nr:transmembrane protein 237-like [Nilaparvata lugens]XP_039277995.1 transmembrane protein 237-like [Nilaparvata lugens]
MSEEDSSKGKETKVIADGVNDEDENKENFDNRRKRRRLKKNGNSRSRSSTDGSSVGYGSGGRHHRSRSSSKRSETIQSRLQYGGNTGHYDGEKHATAITSVLDDLKDDILYCQQSDLKEMKGKLKTVSDIVSSGEEVFIEGRHGFTPASRSTALRNHSSSMWLEDVAELNYQTPLDLAILVQRLFTPLSTICFGLLGGVALMQSFLSYGYLQSNNKVEDLFMFMESYTIFARVAPTTFYILLAVCIVAVFDRFDLAHLDLTHCTDTMFNRQGWFLLIIYLLTLLLTLWSAELDDMLMLYPHDKSFTKNREELYNKLSQWHTLNVCRCIFAMLGWLVISITEPEDLLLQHLKAIKQFDVQPKDILLVSSPSSTARY